MTWQRHNDHAITNGRHWIARLLVKGEPGYLLWFNGRMVHQCFSTSKAAREFAAAREAQEPAAL